MRLFTCITWFTQVWHALGSTSFVFPTTTSLSTSHRSNYSCHIAIEISLLCLHSLTSLQFCTENSHMNPLMIYINRMPPDTLSSALKKNCNTAECYTLTILCFLLSFSVLWSIFCSIQSHSYNYIASHTGWIYFFDLYRHLHGQMWLTRLSLSSCHCLFFIHRNSSPKKINSIFHEIREKRQI